jgi:Integrase core domain/Antibiotic biosynthesis monooxygenase
MKRRPGTATSWAPAAGPVALVLSRQARPGHERAFEEVLHSLAGAVRGQPGHLDVTVLQPAPGGLPPAARPSTPSCRTSEPVRTPMAGWPAHSGRGWSPRLACTRPGELQTRYVSGLEGWPAVPGALAEWQDFYNYHRPHGALGGQTPYERLRQKTTATTTPE